MAVFTKVSADELAHFLQSYDLGTLEGHEGIEQGVSNTNYFVTTTTGRYVLTLFEPRRVRAEDIPFFIDYTIALAGGGMPCPRTMKALDGAALNTLNDRPAALFSVLHGTGAHAGTLTPDMCRQAGETLAQMHMTVQSFKKTAQNRFGLDRWREWLTVIGPDMNAVADGLFRYAADEFDYVASHWPKDLPHGAIHADFFPDNVFFADGDVTGVIDFHFVCTDMFAYDLAIALNAWSFDGANVFQAERMDAMLAGYNAMRPLGREEMLSMPVLLRAAALRFLLSRVEEKLNYRDGDFMKPHDPMVFEQRLRHFQGVERIAA